MEFVLFIILKIDSLTPSKPSKIKVKISKMRLVMFMSSQDNDCAS